MGRLLAIQAPSAALTPPPVGGILDLRSPDPLPKLNYNRSSVRKRVNSQVWVLPWHIWQRVILYKDDREAKIQNLSVTGIRVETRYRCRVGHHVQLVFRLSSITQRWIKIRGVVRNIAQAGPGSSKSVLGIEFVNLSPKNRQYLTAMLALYPASVKS
jgi:hypothetical protein